MSGCFCLTQATPIPPQSVSQPPPSQEHSGCWVLRKPSAPLSLLCQLFFTLTLLGQAGAHPWDLGAHPWDLGAHPWDLLVCCLTAPNQLLSGCFLGVAQRELFSRGRSENPRKLGKCGCWKRQSPLTTPDVPFLLLRHSACSGLVFPGILRALNSNSRMAAAAEELSPPPPPSPATLHGNSCNSASRGALGRAELLEEPPRSHPKPSSLPNQL